MHQSTDDGSDDEHDFAPVVNGLGWQANTDLPEILSTLLNNGAITPERQSVLEGLMLKFLQPDGCIRPGELTQLFEILLPLIPYYEQITVFKHLIHSMNSNCVDEGKVIVKDALMNWVVPHGAPDPKAAVISALTEPDTQHNTLTVSDVTWLNEVLALGDVHVAQEV